MNPHTNNHRSVSPTCQDGRSGFTLTEVLVTIGIIAILCAILLPVIARVREKSKTAACLNNMKQLGLAITMYAHDNSDELPTLGTLAENRGRWMWQIKNYIQTTKVFTCPKTPTSTNDGSQWSAHISYGWAEHLRAKREYGSSNVTGYLLADIASPEETILLGDTGYDGPGDGAEGWSMVRRDPRDLALASSARTGFIAQFRHQTSKTRPIKDTNINKDRQLPIEGRCMFSYVDGRAQTLTPTQAFINASTERGITLTNAERFLLWNLY